MKSKRMELEFFCKVSSSEFRLHESVIWNELSDQKLQEYVQLFDYIHGK